MVAIARKSFDELKSRKENLLKLHSPRSPQDAKIINLIKDYQAVDDKDDPFFQQARFDVCDLHLARGDALPALTELAKASELGSERATKKAADIVSRINTKKFTRSVKAYSSDDVRKTIASIIKKSENGFHKNRLQIYFFVYRKDLHKALALAGVNISEDPRQGVSDFIFLARAAVQRPNFIDFLPAIGSIINDSFKEIIDHDGRSLIQELGEKFKGNDDALDALAIDSDNKVPFDDFVRGSTFHELLTFINNSDAFLYADSLNEEDKNLLIDEFRRRIDIDIASPQKIQLTLLQKASSTLRFWNDPNWRTELLNAMRSRLAVEPDVHGHMVLGQIAYLNGDEVTAKAHFVSCLEGESPYAETGATSFLSSLLSTPTADKFLNYSGITIEIDSYRNKAIVACADETYLERYAVPYLTSLRETGSGCHVHFHIAGNKIRLTEFIKSLTGFGSISFSYENAPVKSPAYFASMRFLKAPFFTERVANCVLLTDIDVSFRSDPENLLDHCLETNSDIMFRVYDTVRIVNQSSKQQRPIYRYPRTYPWAHVNAACLCITNSEMGRLAVSRIARDMADHLASVLVKGRRAWWVDQNSLLFSYRSLIVNPKIKIGNIENFGVPYGSFDYSEMKVVGGASPSLTPKEGQRILAAKPKTSISAGFSKMMRGLRRATSRSVTIIALNLAALSDTDRFTESTMKLISISV